MDRRDVARCFVLGLVLAAALVLPGLIPGASTAAIPGEDRTASLPKTKGWVEARSKHFAVYSDASEAKARKIALQLERFRQALGRISKGLVLEDRFPTSFFAFRNEANFLPYKLDEGGRPWNVAGYFLPTPFRNYVALDTSAFSPMRIVYHEYLHQVLAKSVGDVPLWLNEGLAEFFSTFRTEDRGMLVQVGHPIEEHVAFLSEHGLIPWDDVFRTTRDSPTYNEGVRQGSFYAQSWLATHYLTATDARLKALGAYLVLLREGADPDEAFVRAFGMDRAKAGAAIDAYGRMIRNYIWIDLGENGGENKDAEVALREVPPAEILARLGDLLAQRGQVDAARRHLDAAKAAGWPAGEAEAILGSAAIAARDPQAAEPHLRSAAAAGAAQAEPYVLLGQLLLNRAWNKVYAASGLPPEAAEARGLFAQALEREPDNVPALLGRARTYLFEGTTDPGLEFVVKAKKLKPTDVETLRTGACLLARGGKPALAGAVVASSIAPRNAEMAREASDCLASGAWTAAVERIKAKDYKDASRIVTEALEVVRDPEDRKRIESIGRIAEFEGDVILSDAASDPAMAAYNEAVDLTQAGKYGDAITLLATALKDCTSGPVCDAARDLDARLRQRVRKSDWIAGFNRAVDLGNEGKRKDAIALLRALEQEVDEAEALTRVQDFLRNLGEKPAPRKPPAAGGVNAPDAHL